MKKERITNVLSVFLMLTLFIFTTSCDKNDDDAQDPEDAVTLNMQDELNGKTPLGTSGVYINKANNFYTTSNYIADCGNASGLGVKVAPKLENLVRETAATPGHLYQIFERGSIQDFDSGVRSIRVGAAYYKVYVVSLITADNKSIGAVVKYVLAYPDGKNLPEWEHNLGNIDNIDDKVEMTLPRGAECSFENHDSSGNDGAFDVSTTNGKLVIRLLKSPNQISGPWGVYNTYIRLDNVYTAVTVNVGYRN